MRSNGAVDVRGVKPISEMVAPPRRVSLKTNTRYNAKPPAEVRHIAEKMHNFLHEKNHRSKFVWAMNAVTFLLQMGGANVFLL